MDDLLDKVREQFDGGATSKCMLESILGRIKGEYERAKIEAWEKGHDDGYELGMDYGIEE